MISSVVHDQTSCAVTVTHVTMSRVNSITRAKNMNKSARSDWTARSHHPTAYAKRVQRTSAIVHRTRTPRTEGCTTNVYTQEQVQVRLKRIVITSRMADGGRWNVRRCHALAHLTNEVFTG